MRKIMLIEPSHFRAADVARRRDAAAMELAKPAAKGSVPRVNGGVMIIPLHGHIVHHGDRFSPLFGEVPISEWADRVEAAVNDEAVAGILLDIDSPGGSHDGVPEAAARLFAMRGRKPIIAVANTLAASAAYWIGTAADKLFVSPSGGVGSVGVLSFHIDESRRLDEEGLTVTVFSGGKYKGEFLPFAPLTEEAKKHEGSIIADIYDDFVGAVAKHRGVSAAYVLANYGDGRVVMANSAVEVGMADGVRTLSNVASSMSGAVAAGKRKAEARRLWAKSKIKKFARRP